MKKATSRLLKVAPQKDLKTADLLSDAITASGRSYFPAHHVMIDPFGHKPPGLIHGRLGVMDAIESRTGIERRYIVRPNLLEFFIGRDYSPFAISRYATAIHHNQILIDNHLQLCCTIEEERPLPQVVTVLPRLQ